jgi:iron complex outermembrane receptor protein
VTAGLLASFLAWGADNTARNGSRAFAELSLEELMSIPVTSVSKKETRLSESPAAIFVILPEDIRRVGAASVPEALRMVPGLDVARINANEWAISSRGFNDQYANKLLVLVDGRSVYSPTFAGVHWNAQDLMLDDLERIEVIRGPGATLWGANAVNGVINIMTRSAQDTQGWLATTAIGTDLQPLSNLRYGGQLGTNLFYRAYGQFLNHNDFVETDGSDTGDEWQSFRSGLRLDWHPAEQDQFTLQGDFHRANVQQTFEEPLLTPVVRNEERNAENHNYGANVLGRWTRTLSSESKFSLQLYYDRSRQIAVGSTERRDIFDLDWQHRFAVGQRNDVVWGLGYRYMPDHLSSTENLIWSSERTHDQLFSAFLQSEIKILPEKLSLTLGSKFEHNDYTGFEYQPSGRLLWSLTEKQSLWASVSRAVRTPNRLDTAGRYNASAFQPPLSPPIEVAVLPNSKSRSEELLAYEMGYRVETHSRVALDLAAFYNVYDNLRSLDAGTPVPEPNPPPFHLLLPLQGGNSLHGDTYGVEFRAQWQAADFWRLSAGYTWLHMRLHPTEGAEKGSPQHQFQLLSYLDLSKDLELNAAVYYVDQTSHGLFQSTASNRSYSRLDVGLTWRPTPMLELSVWGQNILDPAHGEFASYHTSFLTEIPRGIFGKITMRL